MSAHTFTLVLDGPTAITPALEDAVHEAGCDDAALGRRGETVYLEFDREGPSFRQALLSAIRDVQAISDVRVVRVEPDEIVTASEIAERVGRTRESVRLLVEGERGPGGFPAPLSGTSGRRARLWRWSEVGEWFASRGISTSRPEEARLIAAVNGALELARNAELGSRREILAAIG